MIRAYIEYSLEQLLGHKSAVLRWYIGTFCFGKCQNERVFVAFKRHLLLWNSWSWALLSDDCGRCSNVFVGDRLTFLSGWDAETDSIFFAARQNSKRLSRHLAQQSCLYDLWKPFDSRGRITHWSSIRNWPLRYFLITTAKNKIRCGVIFSGSNYVRPFLSEKIMRINRPSCDLLNTNAIVIASLRNISTSFRRCFKSVTSSFRQRRFVSISAQFSLFLICCIVTSSAESHARAAMGLHTQELMTALRLREHTDSVAEQDGGSWPQNHVDKSRCGACAFSRTLNDLSADALLRAHELSSLGKRASSAHTRSLLRRCGFSSFAQYYRLCLAPGLDNNDHKPQNKPTSTDSSSRTDVANKPALTRSALTLSRRKRVARGDRRLRRLFSRTQWFLEITADGTVRGSLEKSSTSKSLEIYIYS